MLLRVGAHKLRPVCALATASAQEIGSFFFRLITDFSHAHFCEDALFRSARACVMVVTGISGI